MNNSVTVAQAEQIIISRARDYGNEHIPFDSSIGRVLAEDIKADRDLPPCDRVTMDGIAINYTDLENRTRSFRVMSTIAAGDAPVDIAAGECVEIMTGTALPATADTVIRYEDISITNGIASLLIDKIKKGQNIHLKGRDKKQNDTVATKGHFIDPALISMATSVGKATLLVRKLPKVVIISTGNELIPVNDTPTPYQVRSSNSHTVKAALQRYCLSADLLHLPDEPQITKEKIRKCLERYDVIILSGGVSMGKFDYVPQVLDELSVTKLFHKVQQRPGKPFWFGTHSNNTLVFAFPGNPVSTFMCLHRYFIPWLETSLIQSQSVKTPKYAVLNGDVTFAAPLQYFVQVKLRINEQGQILATPMEGHGSGDFANLLDTDAFMELPLEQSNFKKGEVHRIWPFKQLI